MMRFTGWRKPILISGAGKAVGGILRRRSCFFGIGFFPTTTVPLQPLPFDCGWLPFDPPMRAPPPNPRRLVIRLKQELLAECASRSKEEIQYDCRAPACI